MKNLFAALALAAAIPAFATDYNYGHCPIEGSVNWYGNYPPVDFSGDKPIPTFGPGTCATAYHDGTATFSDTLKMTLAPWPESYGIWEPSGTSMVSVTGKKGNTPCSGRGCGLGQPYEVVIDSATLTDPTGNVYPLNPPVTGLAWTLGIDLPAGTYVFSYTGHATGAISYIGAEPTVSILRLTYTLAPQSGPTCPPTCND